MHLHIITRLAAVSLVVASCGFGALFAYNAGIPHGLPLAVLSVLFAVSLEVLKPLAVHHCFLALQSWRVIQAAGLALLALVAIAYSLTAELSLMAGSRSDHTASRQSAIDTAAKARERYTAAQQELQKLQPSRLVGEIEAELDRTTNDAKWTKLQAELSRANRRVELEAVVSGSGSASTISVADPASSALAMYLEHFGYTVPADILAQWLYLVPVLAIELGSALAMVLVAAAAPSNGPSTRHSGSPTVQLVPSGTAKEQIAQALLIHLQAANGALRENERELAAKLRTNRGTLRRGMQELERRGLLEYHPSKRGTAVKLLASR